jgi:hypothetical protein
MTICAQEHALVKLFHNPFPTSGVPFRGYPKVFTFLAQVVELKSFHAFRVSTDLASASFVGHRLLTQPPAPPLHGGNEVDTSIGVPAWIFPYAVLTAARSTIELLWSEKIFHTQRLEYIRFRSESQECSVERNLRYSCLPKVRIRNLD